ncbi:MAG: DUF58 domain-containing protein [Lachnospiraceae bacterium]|nr:DUF58 domain-containing protein [Lachnospiraceae bacterium]
MWRNRLIVLGLFILSIIAISFFGGPVTYGFFFLMLLIPIVSIAYIIIVYYRHRIYQGIVTKNVVVGTPTDYYFTLQNEDFYSFSGVKVEYYSDFSSISELDDDYEYELPPYTGLKKETILVCKYRGEYEVGIKNITIQDYLRLFRFTFKIKESLRAVVMPRLEILDSLSHLNSNNIRNDSNIAPTEPDVLVREYIPGDDIRSINWKMSAHMGKPFVRTKIGEETQSIGIIMDSCRYSPDEPKDYLPLENKILETTIALVHFYLTHGIGTAVYTYEKMPRNYYLQGIQSFEDFYAAMSEFSFDPDSVSSKLFAAVSNAGITSNSMVYMILHDCSAEFLYLSEILRRNGITVVVYHISDKDDSNINAETDKKIVYQRIGYEDRLKEVL